MPKDFHHTAATTENAHAKPADLDWADVFRIDQERSEEERMIRDTAEAYAQDKLLSRVVEANRYENFDRAIMSEMGELGLLDATLPEAYGGVDANYVSYGLIARRLSGLTAATVRPCRCSCPW